MAVLYRKYRPQAFSEVLGQKYIIRTLKNQVASGSVAHAYLFTGSRGVGKTTLARIVAKAVNCLKPKDGEPCDKCENCKAIVAGNFLDLVEIDAASNTGVDNIRDLIEHVKISPTVGKFKVFIIDEVHMLSKGAFNALLKTLEEPPQHAIFILATTEINKVPATIISRTQRFDFKRFDTADLAGQIKAILKAEKTKLPEEVITLIAENAEGGARDALSLLEKVLTLGEGASLEECQQLLGVTDFNVCHGLLELILAGRMAQIPAFFNGLMEKGLDFAVLNRDFLEYLRKVLIYQVSGGSFEGLAPDRLEQVKAQAALSNPNEMIFITRLFLKSYKDLSVSPRAEIPMLLAALEGVQKKAGKREEGKGKNSGEAISPVSPKSAHSVVAEEPKVSYASLSKTPAVSVGYRSAAADPEPAVEPLTGGDADISLVEVRQWWPKVIDAVKKHNSPLANLIKTATLEDAAGGVVIIGVKFPFHKQNIENQKNQALIRKAIEEAGGKRLAVRAKVIKPGATAGDAAEVNIGDVLQVFGGELIE